MWFLYEQSTPAGGEGGGTSIVSTPSRPFTCPPTERPLSVQENLAHKNPVPWDPTAALCLETFGDLRGAHVVNERSTPVPTRSPCAPPYGSAAIRWSTTLSPKVNLPHAINLRALCGANLVTLRSNIEPRKPANSAVWYAPRQKENFVSTDAASVCFRYRGTSLITKCTLPGPYRSLCLGS
jgi:hypothetical protein